VPPEIDEIDGLAWPRTLNVVSQPRMTSVSALGQHPRHSGHDRASRPPGTAKPPMPDPRCLDVPRQRHDFT
jgi:hypothetical protein